jgi:hypothetical protein
MFITSFKKINWLNTERDEHIYIQSVCFSHMRIKKELWIVHTWCGRRMWQFSKCCCSWLNEVERILLNVLWPMQLLPTVQSWERTVKWLVAQCMFMVTTSTFTASMSLVGNTGPKKILDEFCVNKHSRVSSCKIILKWVATFQNTSSVCNHSFNG